MIVYINTFLLQLLCKGTVRSQICVRYCCLQTMKGARISLQTSTEQNPSDSFKRIPKALWYKTDY